MVIITTAGLGIGTIVEVYVFRKRRSQRLIYKVYKYTNIPNIQGVHSSIKEFCKQSSNHFVVVKCYKLLFCYEVVVLLS